MSTEGLLLDGDGNGVASDMTSSFTVEAPEAASVTVGISDFVRGPGQPVNLPAEADGLPVSISEGTNVRAIDLRISYDPALLQITGADSSAWRTRWGNCDCEHDNSRFGNHRLLQLSGIASRKK